MNNRRYFEVLVSLATDLQSMGMKKEARMIDKVSKDMKKHYTKEGLLKGSRKRTVKKSTPKKFSRYDLARA